MEQSVSHGQIERELAGSAIQAQGHTLQPVARVAGRIWSIGQAGHAAWLRVAPTEVRVTGRDGRVYQVPIQAPGRAAGRWLFVAGALVVPLSWIVRRAVRGSNIL